MPRRAKLTWAGVSACVAVSLVAGGWVGVRTWPRRMGLFVAPFPRVELAHHKLVFPLPAKAVMGTLGSFDNELSAYLWFDYVRGQPMLRCSEVLLTAVEGRSAPVYRLYTVLPNDAVEAIATVAQLRTKGLAVADGDSLVFSNPAEIAYARAQTELFRVAYNKPVQRNLETLTDEQLVSSVARFLIFKSRTDPRARDSTEVRSLSRDQATELAADIIAVAKFYELPLDVFLGIGAMENNYLSIRGDLEHAIWKRRAAKHDIILKRGRHRVLVSDYSIGIWQITRETLRYAHELYLKDKRDYSQLPERLRPPKSLELDLTDSHVLTTYAGLLLRDLLDRFNGDVEKAVGAYNGGFRNPNLRYAAGVRMVAEYARNILERVTAINGKAIAQATVFIERANP